MHLSHVISNLSPKVSMMLCQIGFVIELDRYNPTDGKKKKKWIFHFFLHHPPGTFKALPGKLQSQFLVCNLILTKLDKICRKKIKVTPLLPIKSKLQLNQAEHYTPAAQNF